MALKGTIQNAVVSAFKGLGDLYKDMIYIHSQGSSFNSATGENSEQLVNVATKGVVTNFSSRDRESTLIDADDFKILIPVLELQVKPVTKASIKFDNRTYRIKNFKKDPADAVWVFHMGL